MKENPTIEIAVIADEQSHLFHPIKVDGTVISELGIYQVGKLKIWIVKNAPSLIQLPDHVLPRHADNGENIRDLCKAVNQIIKYLEVVTQEKES